MVYFGKKPSFSKELPFFFAFQQSFYVPNAKILSITFRNSKWITIIQNAYNYL